MAHDTGAVIFALQEPVRMGYHLCAEGADSEHQHEREQPTSAITPQETTPGYALPEHISALSAKVFVQTTSW